MARDAGGLAVVVVLGVGRVGEGLHILDVIVLRRVSDAAWTSELTLIAVALKHSRCSRLVFGRACAIACTCSPCHQSAGRTAKSPALIAARIAR